MTDSDRQRLSNFPNEISEDDLIVYFTLSPNDMELINKCRGKDNKIGFSIQMGALRYLGFSPDDFNSVPLSIVKYTASQLNIIPFLEFITSYGERKPMHHTFTGCNKVLHES